MTTRPEAHIRRRVSGAWLGTLTAAAFVGALDSGLFVATDSQTALKTPGRAAGCLAGLGVWIALLAISGRRWRDGDSQGLATAALAVAVLAALDGVGLAAIHAMARVGGARTLVGAAAGLTALGLALATRRAQS